MRSFIALLFICMFLLISCDKKVIQYPVSYHNDDFMKRSQERGKLLLEEETQIINDYIKESRLIFNRTPFGFWISNEGKPTPSMAKSGDFVKYTYEIEDFDKNVIYSCEEIGEKKAFLGKEDLSRGLHAALQLIEKNDSAVVLLPSFLAYGGFGDRNKIGSDVPILMKIKLLDIQKK